MHHILEILAYVFLGIGLILLAFLCGRLRKIACIKIIIKNGKVVDMQDVPDDCTVSVLYTCTGGSHWYCKENPDAMHA